MPRVDFYLVGSETPGAARVFACRLAEKAYRRGHRVYVAVDDGTVAGEIDALLWTFSQSSFVPHALADSSDALESPVLIGTGAPADGFHEVLLSLRAEVPDYYTRFDRVAEVIGATEAERAGGRQRFRVYREAGLEPVVNHV